MKRALNPEAGCGDRGGRVGDLVQAGVNAQQGGGAAVAIDADDIGGVVTSAKGPEAGVWVIAETTDLPTKFARIVVTDDQGRYVLPDLPPANYQVFVRGYGLVDSARVAGQARAAPRSQSGRRARRTRRRAGLSGELLAEPAGDPQGRTLRRGRSRWKPRRASHAIRWAPVRLVRLPKGLAFASTLEAWDRHTAMGPNGANMSGVFKGLGAQRKAFADWTDRIAAGAYPEAPPRPAGVERNLVISMWDWALPTSRRSDAAATDERTPTLNANGLVYGAIQSSDILAVLDPRDEHDDARSRFRRTGPCSMPTRRASPYWGTRRSGSGRPTLAAWRWTRKGRVWVTARIRAPTTAAGVLQGRGGEQVREVLPDGGPERAADRAVRPEDEAVHDDRQLLCRGP